VKISRFEQLEAWNGTEVLVDAEKRKVVVKPAAAEAPASRALSTLPERQSLPLKVWLNVADPELLNGKWESTVEGIGLYRTEVLFMQSRTDFPSEDEQYEAYRRLFARCLGFPVTIRTLDIGGDKTLSYFSLGPQENPYMGLRAHRIYRFHPELFIDQMKSILRAKPPELELRILYPMVGDVEELSYIQKLTMKALHALGENGKDCGELFSQGVLLEVPSAVWHLESLLKRVDFASVGTNDLLQFFHACDRNNANVTAYYRPEDPGFLRMLKYLIDTAHYMEKPLGICGEMAADVDLLPVLVGLGFENISVDLHSLPAVARVLSNLDVSSCASIADACMSARTAYEVREIIRRFNGKPVLKGVITRKNMVDVDPVCGMHVFTGANSLSAVLGERTYHFCSKMCMERFLSGRERKEVLQ
jgi:phosphoenolpyruvate-protein kinase (PTS system EI component)/YHS domain-containing protein